ncbi:hypothetical protein ACHAXN_004759 [Cyclotella atomus]
MTRAQANLTIRQATSDDYFPTENLTRDSFWNMYKPGCDEHLMLHQMRNSSCYIPQLDIVALNGSDLAGHAICTRAVVKEGENDCKEVLCLGPICVHTSMQSQGIGSKLMNHSIAKAKELGYAAIVVFGNPLYYQRFGFRNAKEYGVTTRDGQNFDPFMLCALDEEKMKRIRGAFLEADAFTVDADKLAEFDRRFPHREKGDAKIKI